MAARVKPLWHVSVTVGSDAEDAVAELLANLFEVPASGYTAVETGRAIVSVYLETVEREKVSRLKNLLAAVCKDLAVPAATVSVRRIRREDWAESWKRHFKPIEVSPRLLVSPSWSKRKAKRGQVRIVLDPGLSFGTGQHPTTGFCLKQVDALRREGTPQSFLDAGCGSGILAIAAAKLGYSRVEAFDFDPDAVRVAKENAAINDVRLRIVRQDLEKLPEASRQQFDVICANLIYDLLIRQRDKLLNRLAPGGTIVVAGILAKQFAAVKRVFNAANARLVADATEGEWRSGAFRCRAAK